MFARFTIHVSKIYYQCWGGEIGEGAEDFPPLRIIPDGDYH